MSLFRWCVNDWDVVLERSVTKEMQSGSDNKDFKGKGNSACVGGKKNYSLKAT